MDSQHQPRTTHPAAHPHGEPPNLRPPAFPSNSRPRARDKKGAYVSETENLYGDEHVRRYRETGGEVGHLWRRGSKVLLLTTKGRRTGEPHTTPLIYENDGDAFVIVASKGGAPAHPGWYRNLTKHPQVELQVKDRVLAAHARTATGEERDRLWKLAAL